MLERHLDKNHNRKRRSFSVIDCGGVRHTESRDRSNKFNNGLIVVSARNVFHTFMLVAAMNIFQANVYTIVFTFFHVRFYAHLRHLLLV